MKDAENTAAELAYLFKLLPVFQEVETVDRIYRLLLAMATSGRSIGFDRAMLFVVDEEGDVIRGRYGTLRGEFAHARRSDSFEAMARDVFDRHRNIESSDETLKARSFTVPLLWHRCGLIKAVKTGYPVVAQKELSEFATDPFFDFFESRNYIAVPIRVDDRVTAVIAADRGDDSHPAADDISRIYSITQQASLAAGNLIERLDQKRKARILWKLHNSLANAERREELDSGLKLALIMVSRAIGGTGCLLKDYTQQRTTHVKSVQDFVPDADERDVIISSAFDEILDHTAGKMETVTGGGNHALIGTEAAAVVRSFIACPLVIGGDVIGALCVYSENAEKGQPRRKKWAVKPSDRSFVELCAGTVASVISGKQKDERIDRIETLVEEMRANLTRERDRARIGERTTEYQDGVRKHINDLCRIVSNNGPHSKRFPQMATIVKAMKADADAFAKALSEPDDHFTMVSLFALTRQMVEPWKAQVAKRGIDVTVRIPASGPSLLLDREKIGKALRSILTATEACLSKGNHVLVECSTSDERALVCIADNGHGLPGDSISRLFMPFESPEGDDERHRALSLAGEVLQKHSGEIIIKSSLSWKTILILSLPLASNRDRRASRKDRRRRRERRLAAKA